MQLSILLTLATLWLLAGVRASNELDIHTTCPARPPSLFPTQGQTIYEAANVLQRHRDWANELGRRLSLDASIHFNKTEEFASLTERWALFAVPRFVSVLDARTERDVQLAVQHANRFGLPFLAISGRHGLHTNLARMQVGIEIYLGNINHVQVNGQTANIGGGSLSGDVLYKLWPHRKQTLTGTCECTSLLGPALGGGYGFLQGYYGLGADQIVSVRLVTAAGELLTVNDKYHSDLFWAIKGAGHNFGIVTEVEYKIYDVPEDDVWTYSALTFTGDKLEQMAALDREITAAGRGPVEYVAYIWLLRKPELDSQKNVAIARLTIRANQTVASKYIDRYRALGPVEEYTTETNFANLSYVANGVNGGLACRRGLYSALRFPVSFETWNLTTVRRVYDRLNEMMNAQPGFARSFYLFESYSQRAVKAVDFASTAVPDRFNNHLTSPVIVWSDRALDEEAVEAGRELSRIALDGKPGVFNSYPNYAMGFDETVEDWYGHEAWRIERLTSLKRKYDPLNRFQFYAPIVQNW